jgi:hypothetical protein
MQFPCGFSPLLSSDSEACSCTVLMHCTHPRTMFVHCTHALHSSTALIHVLINCTHPLYPSTALTLCSLLLYSCTVLIHCTHPLNSSVLMTVLLTMITALITLITALITVLRACPRCNTLVKGDSRQPNMTCTVSSDSLPIHCLDTALLTLAYALPYLLSHGLITGRFTASSLASSLAYSESLPSHTMPVFPKHFLAESGIATQMYASSSC